MRMNSNSNCTYQLDQQLTLEDVIHLFVVAQYYNALTRKFDYIKAL